MKKPWEETWFRLKRGWVARDMPGGNERAIAAFDVLDAFTGDRDDMAMIEARANLAAAAPELYRVLEEIDRVMGGALMAQYVIDQGVVYVHEGAFRKSPLGQRMTAALRKARGEDP